MPIPSPARRPLEAELGTDAVTDPFPQLATAPYAAFRLDLLVFVGGVLTVLAVFAFHQRRRRKLCSPMAQGSVWEARIWQNSYTLWPFHFGGPAYGRALSSAIALSNKLSKQFDDEATQASADDAALGRGLTQRRPQPKKRCARRWRNYLRTAETLPCITEASEDEKLGAYAQHVRVAELRRLDEAEEIASVNCHIEIAVAPRTAAPGERDPEGDSARSSCSPAASTKAPQDTDSSSTSLLSVPGFVPRATGPEGAVDGRALSQKLVGVCNGALDDATGRTHVGAADAEDSGFASIFMPLKSVRPVPILVTAV